MTGEPILHQDQLLLVHLVVEYSTGCSHPSSFDLLLVNELVGGSLG